MSPLKIELLSSFHLCHVAHPQIGKTCIVFHCTEKFILFPCDNSRGEQAFSYEIHCFIIKTYCRLILILLHQILQYKFMYYVIKIFLRVIPNTQNLNHTRSCIFESPCTNFKFFN